MGAGPEEQHTVSAWHTTASPQTTRMEQHPKAAKHPATPVGHVLQMSRRILRKAPLQHPQVRKWHHRVAAASHDQHTARDAAQSRAAGQYPSMGRNSQWKGGGTADVRQRAN